METFAKHGPMTFPGKHSAAVDALPGDVASLLEAVRGVFVHSDYLGIYGLVATDYPSYSRETLCLENRLDQVFQKSHHPLTTKRPIGLREVGTCRDYSVMSCSLMRQKSIPARVRCGFSRYFTFGRYEDHWICEYWKDNENRWARADAQLDSRHCDHLGIAFDTSDLPDGEFVTAKEAWNLICNDGIAPELFGHGDACGKWFVWVNLARDYLSLKGQETSPWDQWRKAIGVTTALEAFDHASCVRIAENIRNLEEGGPAEDCLPLPQPFWRTGTG